MTSPIIEAALPLIWESWRGAGLALAGGAGWMLLFWFALPLIARRR